MYHVIFIVYPGFEVLDVSGPAAVLNGANHALGQRGKQAFYKVVVASGQGSAVESSSGVTVETRPIGELRPAGTQTVLVAGAERDPLLVAVSDPVLRGILPRLVGKAERFGSVCTGGFLLAALGHLTAVASARIGTPASPSRKSSRRSWLIPMHFTWSTAICGLRPG
ncbi:DJ-1/PfpI family protein [Chelatococcus sp.]|nr:MULTISPECIES: DJ-1/PfpI family protein [unclassified Chelatococcus]MCO5075531.1 DJ-1/PfpI family protein [Chelatococcus sp.]